VGHSIASALIAGKLTPFSISVNWSGCYGFDGRTVFVGDPDPNLPR
jgi:hypothetical protein